MEIDTHLTPLPFYKTPPANLIFLAKQDPILSSSTQTKFARYHLPHHYSHSTAHHYLLFFNSKRVAHHYLPPHSPITTTATPHLITDAQIHHCSPSSPRIAFYNNISTPLAIH